MKWAYGVRTVLQEDRVRLHNYLPRTLESLYRAGFEKPWLFVDGAMDYYHYERFGCPIVTHYPALGVTNNFLLALLELMLRFPDAHRYALFEDDLLICRNTRQYLDRMEYRPRTYWNLYTCPYYQNACPPWRRGRGKEGFYRSPQAGQGAVALVFDRTAALAVVSSQWLSHTILRHPGAHALDGLIVTALNQAGIRECAHTPSLVQHTGEVSTFWDGKWEKQDWQAISFPGEDFDALDLIQ